MSGPKYSQLELEQQRQRQIELERQRRLEEEKKKKQLQRSISKEEEMVKKLTDSMSQLLNRLIIEIQENKLEDRLIYTKLLSQKEKTYEKVQGFTITFDKNSIPSMEAQA